jgi:Gpi18-like mannosyltransferase
MNSLTAQITTPRKAYLTWILYLLAPSPAVLASLYTEALFACLTFSGFGMVIRRRHYAAAILLAGATSIRATGVLAAPTIAVMAVFRGGSYRIPLSVSWVVMTRTQADRYTFMRRTMAIALPCLIVIAPLFAFQYYAYLSFCRPEASVSWCHDRIPIAYSAVQAKYW